MFDHLAFCRMEDPETKVERVTGVVRTKDILAIHAADVVEVVHGRWEYLQDDEWRCSNCHTVFNTGGKWIPVTDNFCSECGADMRERRDNDDR